MAEQTITSVSSDRHAAAHNPMADSPDPVDHQVRWGKVLNQSTCIGCDACTVACKAEHEVPLGVTRTYVKSVDVGVYPTVSRHFQVTRCNQCDNAPCVPICPVTAMFKRDDGIVDFNRDICIGCKACMAACPYDAIYIDPESHSAEKCNFCAHRIDQGLEPACVSVCPEQAIVIGDLNDPMSAVSERIARQKVDVRKPEKDTQPKVFYEGASEHTLVPAAATYAAGHAHAEQRERYPVLGPANRGAGNSAAAAIVHHDFPHKAPWDWRVSGYTFTKSIAAGAYLIPVLFGLGSLRLAGDIIALIFLMATSALLVADLKHPERFLSILYRPQWKSWLARGAFILVGFGAVIALDTLSRLLGWHNLSEALRWPGVPLAAMAAMYTAFLFAQAKGRDLWQNPLLPLHLLTQAFMAGAAVLVFFPGVAAVVSTVLLIALAMHMALVLSELVIPHVTGDARRAAANLTRGIFAGFYWSSVGLAVAALVVVFYVPMLAGALALVGLAAYEHAYVQAGQSVPLS